jgi:hypothetical protein
MDPFASKLAFSAAVAGAALMGALFPHPSYEAVAPARPWASSGAANAWQPASGQMFAQASETYSYSGALPSDRGPIDVYGAHGWRLAREREILVRQEAELQRAVAQAVWPKEEAPAVIEPQGEVAGVEVHRGSKPAEAGPIEPAESAEPLAEVSDE